MNIADLLQKALEECNWEFVSDVYEIMTGKKIEPPAPDDVLDMLSNISEKISNLESNLLSDKKQSVKKKKPVNKVATPKKTEVQSDFSVASSKPSRKISGQTRENKFEQMLDVIHEAERESGYDKINDKIKPTSRSRKAYANKSVICNECNKTFKVNPMFVRDNYICDRCLGKRG
jgi:hypothetical protein